MLVRDATPQSSEIRKFDKCQNVANKCINCCGVNMHIIMCIDLISSG